MCIRDSAIIVGVDKIDQIVIDKCPKLKAICKFGVGTDNIDVAYAESKNIYVGRTVGSNSNAVAEHVMSFIYCESKNLWTTIRDVRNH
ncbi:3-phosphoglycerate dehydrogenase, partial [Enterococcus sp. S181_ASV_20]|nr:3-phosphoglycerate dehydrogenase [Enterococcus sp. S181_ASV_20]